MQLKTKTQRSLIDFIATLLEIATKVATRKNIVWGFIATGHIDSKHQRFLVFKKVMAGCRRTIPQDVYDSVVANYPRFLNEMLEHRQISEDVYDELGFDRDRDANGREVIEAPQLQENGKYTNKRLKSRVGQHIE